MWERSVEKRDRSLAPRRLAGDGSRGQRDGGPGRRDRRDRRRDASGRRPDVAATPQAEEAPFLCGHCGRRVPALPSGGRHRNHCPYCLYSRHVDARETGDRASACGELMEPLGTFQRRNGEYVLVHRCLGCGFERFNRIAADDDLPLALSLPSLAPRMAEGSPVVADNRAETAPDARRDQPRQSRWGRTAEAPAEQTSSERR